MNIRSILVALALVTATPSYSATVEECYGASTVVVSVAILRDSGAEPNEVGAILMQSGITFSAARNIVTFVYGIHKDKTPEEIEVEFMNFCVGLPS